MSACSWCSALEELILVILSFPGYPSSPIIPADEELQALTAFVVGFCLFCVYFFVSLGFVFGTFLQECESLSATLLGVTPCFQGGISSYFETQFLCCIPGHLQDSSQPIFSCNT